MKPTVTLLPVLLLAAATAVAPVSGAASAASGFEPPEAGEPVEPQDPLRDYSIPEEPQDEEGLGDLVPPDLGPGEDFDPDEEWKNEVGSQEATDRAARRDRGRLANARPAAPLAAARA